MNRTCEYCGVVFKTHNSKARFCSKSCVTKNSWKEGKIVGHKTEEYREKAAIVQKEVQNRPEIKANKSKCLKERWNDPEKRMNLTAALTESIHRTNEQRSETVKNLWKDDDFREKQTLVCQNTLKASQEQRVIGIKKNWENVEYKEKMREISKEVNNRPEVKAKITALSLKKWEDPLYAHNMMTKRYKYKNYTMPSGKIVKIQGYEPQVLTELLKSYSEDDIIIGVKEMNKEIGQIKYTYNDNIHTYYPDFYIKSENKIIEVKSQWTFDKWKEKNIAKQNACIEQGFCFELIIL